MADTLLAAGRSDKYGQVHVERVGNTGFDDPDEPVALLRAQDDLAYWAMMDYLRYCRSDPAVPAAQVASVERQLESFEAWRRAHPEKLRKPGTRNRAPSESSSYTSPVVFQKSYAEARPPRYWDEHGRPA